MIHSNKIVQAIYGAVDEANQLLPKERQLGKSLDTVLFGKSGTLDSLGLVHFIVAIEQKLEDELGISITLADERAVSQQHSPFKSIRTLAEYIAALLNTSTRPVEP